MKEKFLELVHQAEDVRKMAHEEHVKGFFESEFVLYDVPEFITWKQKLLLELQQFSKKDEFINSTIEIINRINGYNDKRDFNELVGALTALEGKIDNYYKKGIEDTKMLENKDIKVFISHSSKDVEYIEAFVNLLEDIGLREDDIVCSSIPPYCIPLNDNVYEWLVDKFQNCELHVMYMLSNNYYGSAASLNEMGAAWAMKQKWTGMLLPGFDFKDIQGCIDQNQISIKLDDADVTMLKYRLGELKDSIINEFGLRNMSSSLWERKRDAFLTKISEIELKNDKVEERDGDTGLEKTIITEYDKMSHNACVMLAYASDDANGEIIHIEFLSGTSIVTRDNEFIKSNTPRETAMWKAVLKDLTKQGYLECNGEKQEIYTVTNSGYVFADEIKRKFNIDTRYNVEKYVQD